MHLRYENLQSTYMKYHVSLFKGDDELAIMLEISPEMAVDIMAAALNAQPSQPALDPVPRKYNKRAVKGTHDTGNHKWAELGAADDEHKKRQHPETGKIEELLMEGKTTVQIIEQIKVSAPTIGVIRARLRKEGKLTA